MLNRFSKYMALLITAIMLVTAMPLDALAAVIAVDSSEAFSPQQLGGIQSLVVTPDEDVYVTFEFYSGDALFDTKIVNQTDGGSVAMPATPDVPSGKKFLGWFIGNTAFVPGVVSGYPATTTVRVDAKFSDVYYAYFLTVDRNVFATQEATSANGFKVAPPSNYEPTGKRVTGWTANGQAFTASTVLTADTYVTPVTVDCYWITFNTMGGSSIASRYLDKGQSLNVSGITPTRMGYTFAGWYLNENGTGAKQTTVKPTADMILFAKWTPGDANYTVVYWGENADDTAYSVLATAVVGGTTGNSVTLNASTGALPGSVSEKATSPLISPTTSPFRRTVPRW